MAMCKRCGHRRVGLLTEYCGECAPLAYSSGNTVESDTTQEPPAAPVNGPASPQAGGGSAGACALIGLACLAIGGYLLIDPTITVPGYAGIGTEKVANIHMMTLGETLSIIGAIFLAAAIRPR